MLLNTLFAFNYLCTVILIIYGIKIIEDNRARWLHVVMMSCFLGMRIMDIPIPIIGTWIKHSIFYLGLVFFYFFVTRIIKIYGHTQAHTSVTPVTPVLAYSVTHFLQTNNQNPHSWAQFITGQGLQHILGLPIFFMVTALIKVQYNFITSNCLKPILDKLIIAAFLLTMLHVSEFVIESQKWLALTSYQLDVLEHAWFFSAFCVFIYTFYQWSKAATAHHAHAQ